MGYIFDKIRHLLELVDEQKLWVELDDLALMLEREPFRHGQTEAPRSRRREIVSTEQKERAERGEQADPSERQEQDHRRQPTTTATTTPNGTRRPAPGSRSPLLPITRWNSSSAQPRSAAK